MCFHYIAPQNKTEFNLCHICVKRCLIQQDQPFRNSSSRVLTGRVTDFSTEYHGVYNPPVSSQPVYTQPAVSAYGYYDDDPYDFDYDDMYDVYDFDDMFDWDD